MERLKKRRKREREEGEREIEKERNRGKGEEECASVRTKKKPVEKKKKVDVDRKRNETNNEENISKTEFLTELSLRIRNIDAKERMILYYIVQWKGREDRRGEKRKKNIFG